MPAKSKRPPQALHDGISACREGDWRAGLTILTRLAQETEGKKVVLPGFFYSYLGVAMARVEGRKQEGFELCRYGISLGPKDPDNRLNLARIYLIAHNRRQAVKQLDIGLRISPANKQLREFRREIGYRRPPPIRFLARSNPLNMWLGRFMHRAARQQEAYQEMLREEAEIERLANRE